MLVKSSALLLLSAVQASFAALTESNLQKDVNVLDLDFEFGPVKASYWTGYPHHRRTPFAVSPDGKSAYIAYLDSSETDVHVQPVDPTTFKATGTTVTLTGAKEAGGLVAQNDGFAVMVNEPVPSGTANAPPGNTPVPVLYRYTNGAQSWKTWLAGPTVTSASGSGMAPDMNGDLVYSAAAGLYGAYFVVTDYTGDADGHFGDSIQYVNEDGALQTISGATSTWGCSHNTGIAFEAADAAPFASICAEDQGAIWLNTKGQGMTTTGVKISNENTTNGGDGEPMGGMSGSYSALAQFATSTNYIFSWVSRGAIDLSENTWMGTGYTHSLNRTNPRNVAIALFSDKYTKVGAQATSEVGATDGDSQVNWITQGANDCSNAHAATFGADNALVTWEEIENPICDYIAMGCRGQFAGSYFQQVDSTGAKVGAPLVETDTYVAGDMVTMSDGRVCWPYVSMTWDLSQPVPYAGSPATTKQMSFACISLDGSSGTTTTAASSSVASPSSSAAASSVSSAAVEAVSSTSSAAAVGSSSASAATSIVPTTLVTSARSSTVVPPMSSAPIASQPATPITSAASSEASSTDEDPGDCDDSGDEDETSAVAIATSSAALTTASSVALPTISSAPLPTVSAPANASGIVPPIPSASSASTGGLDPSTLEELYQWISAMLSDIEKMLKSAGK
ncbi:MAG: hypothetical protein Q9165_008143 [Trypethelium subeluteriae]